MLDLTYLQFAGYRFLYDDYHDTNFLYRVIMHGAQITLGLNF